MLLLPVLALGFVAVILVWQVRSAQKTVATIQASDDSIAAATRCPTVPAACNEEQEAWKDRYANVGNALRKD